jgi:iron complex outermembrane receptor protein
MLWETATTKQLELETQILSPEDRDDDVGEIGTPELKFNSTLSLRLNDWEFMMQNRYIDAGKGDTEFEYEPIFYLSSPTMAIPITFVDSVWYTDMSLTYGSDSWSVTAGVNNLFDQDPPIVRSFGGQGSNRNGAVTSSGYDLVGRSYFASLQFGF